jgi:hypothetical protein
MSKEVIDMTPLPTKQKKVHWSKRDLDRAEVLNKVKMCRTAGNWGHEAKDTLAEKAKALGITLKF